MDAAKKDSMDALYQVGVCYSYGKGTQIDKKKGFEFYLKSAKIGNPRAMFAVGHVYQYGIVGVDVNYQLAKDWYEKAAAQGHNGALKALQNF